VHEGAHWVWSSSLLVGRNPIRIPGSGLQLWIPIDRNPFDVATQRGRSARYKLISWLSLQVNYSLAVGQEGINRAWGLQSSRLSTSQVPLALHLSYACRGPGWGCFQRGPFFKGCPLGTGKVPPLGRIQAAANPSGRLEKTPPPGYVHCPSLPPLSFLHSPLSLFLPFSPCRRLPIKRTGKPKSSERAGGSFPPLPPSPGVVARHRSLLSYSTGPCGKI
jgi:hypothetical protein